MYSMMGAMVLQKNIILCCFNVYVIKYNSKCLFAKLSIIFCRKVKANLSKFSHMLYWT